MITRLFYITTILSFFFATIEAQNHTRYTATSVLSEGDWYKIKIKETGVYKLTYENLKTMGISNPANVKVYGYGGWVLDQNFTNSYLKDQDDLPQVAVWMSKPQSQFGAGDYVLFYGKGDIKWEYDQTKNVFVHKQNPYSSDSYYFITESESPSLLVKEEKFLSGGSAEATSYTDYYLHEKELKNISETGMEFYGEDFRTKNVQDFAVSLPGITSDPANIYVNFIARSEGGTPKATLFVNNNEVSSQSITKTSDYYVKATAVNLEGTLNKFTENNVVKIAYQQGNVSDRNVHLNFIRINYSKTLKPYGAVTSFRSKSLNNALTYKISNASNKIQVFDVTQGELPKMMETKLEGTTLSFTASNSQIREYVMVDLSKTIPAPTLVGKIKNQNLHALAPKEMVIITRPGLRKYAEELAQIHMEDSGLESMVVDAEDIYNEFSSGKPDVTAYRRFLKMFYDKADGDLSKSPQYVALFGDGTYDNRFISTKWSETYKKNMLLTFQSEISINENSSFVSDDYIGFLDDSEGLNLNRDKLDIAIGRLPVRTESEAVGVLKKIKQYIADEGKSLWKNNLGFVADDLTSSLQGRPSTEFNHVKYSDEYTRNIAQLYPNFISNKIYMDTYQREITANGARYPGAKKELLDKINSGLLVLNYVGHGSTRNWAHENMLLIKDVEDMTNTHLPLVITATCDFGRFDADDTSGGETFLLNPNGGAIALFTTVRVVYGTSNHTLNTKIFENLFKKSDHRPIRLGDVLRSAKLDLTDSNKLRFTLLGDPALRLSYPDDTYNVKVTAVNNVDASDSDIQLKAYSKVEMKGKIVDASDVVVPNFNGILDAVVFDSKQSLKTRGAMSDGSFDPDFQLSYTDYTNTIYSGKIDIENGEFTINFIVPKDILYSNDYGKMIFYALDKATGMQAQGSYQNYKVGGVDNDSDLLEENSPVISEIYLNRSDFQSGDKVNHTPTLYAKVSDDSGINITGGIGHTISVLIDGKTSYDLTSSFVSDNVDITSGEIKYHFSEGIPEGKHTLLFKVWDIWNNSASTTLNFEVMRDYKPVVYDFTINGNPAKDKTRFEFVSDISGSKADVRYQVYSMTGALQWSKDVSGTNYDMEWDLVADNGTKLQPGVYICRMTVSVDGGAKTSKSKKLIVLTQ